MRWRPTLSGTLDVSPVCYCSSCGPPTQAHPFTGTSMTSRFRSVHRKFSSPVLHVKQAHSLFIRSRPPCYAHVSALLAASMMLSDPYTPINPLHLYLLTILSSLVCIHLFHRRSWSCHAPASPPGEVYSFRAHNSPFTPICKAHVPGNRSNPSSLLLSSDLAPDESSKYGRITVS